MVVHFVRIGALAVLTLACTFLPYLPGRYDGLAAPLSVMAQSFGVVGLLLVPVGALWLIYELRKRASKNVERRSADKGYYFAIVSLVASSVVMATVTLAAIATMGFSLGLGVLALWAYCVRRLAHGVKGLKGATTGHFNPAPLYLVVVPTVVALFQFSLLDRATDFSRHYAITKSADLIADIEQYRAVHGRYPTSLLGVSGDYQPSVIGIDRFHYEPHGDAYNIVFEQPSPRFGTREFVVYNKRDEHFIISHASDRLVRPEEELFARRGFYAAHDAASPHWKYFWFD
jgi:hypothetical protein